jgi:hypothetical protein
VYSIYTFCLLMTLLVVVVQCMHVLCIRKLKLSTSTSTCTCTDWVRCKISKRFLNVGHQSLC